MIKAIFAVDDKFGIGKDGTLPWSANKEDLKKFKEHTTNHIIVMGSKTWDDPCFPNPLPNRENYIVSSRDIEFDHPNVHFIKSNLEETVKKLDEENPDKDVWIIGGVTIINQLLHIIEEIRLTQIPGDFNCDTFIDYPVTVSDFFISDYYLSETGNAYVTLVRLFL